MLIEKWQLETGNNREKKEEVTIERQIMLQLTKAYFCREPLGNNVKHVP